MKTSARYRLGGFLAAVLLAGCGKPAPPRTIPPARVTAEKAVLASPDLFYQTFGNLVSPGSVDIVSQVTGKIAEARFREGDPVKAGDVLFTVETDIYQAKTAAAEAQLKQSEAQLKLDEITLERNRGLLEKKLISQQDYDTLSARVEGSQGQRDLAAAQLDQARINLGYCLIGAPVSGKTGKRLVDPGNVVLADQGPTLVNLKVLDPLYLDFSVSEDFFREISDELEKGPLEARLTPAGDFGEFTGSLKFLNNTVNTQSASFDLRAEVPNPDLKLWPGLYAVVELRYGKLENVVVVPATAVQMGQKGPFVYVVGADGKAQLRNPVKLGPPIKDGVVIAEGVKAGEMVVTTGQLGLREGREVSVMKPSASPAPAGGEK